MMVIEPKHVGDLLI